MNYRRLYLALLTLSLTCLVYPQGKESIDWQLSSLRGLWEYHTYYDRWTFLFESDSRVIINKEHKNYALFPEVIRIEDGGSVIEYPYQLKNDELTIQYPDGTRRTLKHKDRDESDQQVMGRFYYTDSMSSHHSIALKEDGMFYEGTLALGIYRVEGNVVVVTQYDGTILEAEIRYWGKDGNADGIIYNGNLYDKDNYAGYTAPSPTPYSPPIDPPFPPPPPGPCLCASPDPPPVIPISPAPAPSTAKNNDEQTIRGFGVRHEGGSIRP